MNLCNKSIIKHQKKNVFKGTDLMKWQFYKIKENKIKLGIIRLDIDILRDIQCKMRQS